MNILTIPNDNENVNLTALTDGGISEVAEWNWQQDYAFHRHCQKTVCSAYGYNGNGKTWSIIYPGNGPLENLQSCLPPGVTWYSYFTGHVEANGKNNITNDLRSILELIDKVAGKLFSSLGDFTLTFKDSDGNVIGEPRTINLINDSSRNYEFGGFGRKVKLKVGGVQAALFNTIHEVDGEQLDLPLNYLNFKFGDLGAFQQVGVVMPAGVNVSIPYHKLKLAFGNNTAFTETNVAMQNDVTMKIPYNDLFFKLGNNILINSSGIKVATASSQTLTIPKDWNRIPATTSYNEGAAGQLVHQTSDATRNTYTLILHPDVHIYRIEHKENKKVKLKLDFRNYGSVFTNRDRGQQIVEFEVHVSNEQMAGDIEIENIRDQGSDGSYNLSRSWIQNYPTDVTQPIHFTYLNDENIVRKGQCNVFVFRVDMYHVAVTWSLAYIYNIGWYK